MINFPSSLDSLTNPGAGSALNSPSHSEQHANSNDAIEALQAKVGADSSAVTTSHDYKIAQLESGKQDTLGFTPEDVANKENTTIDTSTTKYPTVNLLKTVKDTIPVKATGAEISSGTDDAKYATAKAMADSDYIKDNDVTRTATWSLVESDKEVAIGTALGGDWRIPGNRAIKIKKVGAYVDTAGTTGVTTIDINEAGTSILSTKITIDSGSKSSVGATTPPVISDTNIAADAILTFDVDGVSTTKPKGLKVYIEFTY